MRLASIAGVGAGASGVLAACAGSPNDTYPTRIPKPLPTSRYSDEALATSEAAALAKAAAKTVDAHADMGSASVSVQKPETQEHDMDAMHEAGVKQFLANAGKDPTFWSRRLEPKLDGAVKVFNITASEVEWTVRGAEKVSGMGYNGMVPGPEIRVVEGETLRFVLTNNLKESTAMHFHGCLVPNAVDGVPFITQPVVKPGQTFTYEFVARNPGSHMYHSHHNAAVQVTSGLLGALIIEPKDLAKDPAFDSDYTIILNDTVGGFTMNGKQFPDTQPIVAKKGERVRIRYMNEGLMIHPMHLHGLEQIVFAKDGWNLPQPYTCDTVNVAPGERFDVLVNAHTEGVWAFHCHILTHAESAEGMFGMVTVMIVQ